jgi:hypothetical protein
MVSPRTWRREARILLVVRELTQTCGSAAVEDILALDFLLQHPSALAAFVKLGKEPWPTQSLPTLSEAQSSEETLLRWKRSIATAIVAPVLGRLVGRGLISHTSPDTLIVTDPGLLVGNRVITALSDEGRERLMLTVRDFAADPPAGRERLRRSLIEGIS